MKSGLLLCSGLIAAVVLAGCGPDEKRFDASGTFEADEVIVSSEVPGRIMELNFKEGTHLPGDSIVGYIDSSQLQLQKAQVEATISSLHEKTANVEPQVKYLRDQADILKVQLANALREKGRTERLVKADAATQKQLDDMNDQIEVIRRQIDANEQQIRVQRSNTATQNSSILSEARPLKKSVAQIEDQLKRTNITNPIDGTVLTKYAMAGEYTTPGKAIYKIADLSTLTLRAYVTGTQLAGIKLDQQVGVFIDSTAKTYRQYPGVISWISDKAEFTPKTIQTKDERGNLVYAVKIRVKNDGYLKIGMYGEVKL